MLDLNSANFISIAPEDGRGRGPTPQNMNKISFQPTEFSNEVTQMCFISARAIENV